MGIVDDDHRRDLHTEAGWTAKLDRPGRPGFAREARRGPSPCAMAARASEPGRPSPRGPICAPPAVAARVVARLPPPARGHPRRVLTHLDALYGHERRLTVSALRSLFTWARKKACVFRTPATGIQARRARHPVVWQPLSAGSSRARSTRRRTPQARLFVALAAVHAARLGRVRALQLDDVDLASRRLRLRGTATTAPRAHARRVLREWLDHRRRRWPHTRQPAPAGQRQDRALRHGPVSGAWASAAFAALPATLERLRIDRPARRGLATGFDPLHLAGVFGISEPTAVRYSVNARLLTGWAHQQAPPGTVNPGRQP